MQDAAVKKYTNAVVYLQISFLKFALPSFVC